MIVPLGPSHYLDYGALHRRGMWLEHLSMAANLGSPESRDLNRAFQKTLAPLAATQELGIIHPERLRESLVGVLDDTPVDSFLANLASGLAEYEARLFCLLVGRPPQDLIRVSLLWGREVAQEHLVATRGASPRNGLFELCGSLLEAGEVLRRPLLLRRRCHGELEYELMNCPHRRQDLAWDAKTGSRDLACRLESLVYRGFAEAIAQGARHERRVTKHVCVDRVSLSADPA